MRKALLLLLFFSVSFYAFPLQSVKGKVTGEKNGAAHCLVFPYWFEGTNAGTVTDPDAETSR